MFGLVFVVIAIVAVVGVITLLATLFDMTMGAGPGIVAERDRATRLWHPPFVRGASLRAWSRSVSETVVDAVLRRNGDASLATDLVAELDGGGSRAMLPTVSQITASRRVPCPEAGQGEVLVTAPEAIGIAEHLRRRLSKWEVQRIRDHAARNTEVIAEGGADPDSLPCALQGEDCVCRSYEVRPVGCRPLHAAAIAGAVGLGGPAMEDGDPGWEAHAEEVGRGLTEGLTRGLERAGLDAERYELNGALVVALDTPDASARWARGEDVFAEVEPNACSRIAVSTL